MKITILLIAVVALFLSLKGCSLTLRNPDSVYGKHIMRLGQLLGVIILFYIALTS